MKKAGWKTPKDHPDIDPPHEASILAQQYRDTSQAMEKQKQLSEWLGKAGTNARQLETLLRQAKANVDSGGLEPIFTRMDCSRCHANYRDSP